MILTAFITADVNAYGIAGSWCVFDWLGDFFKLEAEFYTCEVATLDSEETYLIYLWISYSSIGYSFRNCVSSRNNRAMDAHVPLLKSTTEGTRVRGHRSENMSCWLISDDSHP